MAFLDGDSMRTLIEGAAYLFCNEYEEAVIESEDRMVQRGHPGAGRRRGSSPSARPAPGSSSKGAEPVVVGPVTDAKFVEPTGAGDAFRCGFLAAVSWGLSTERAIQLGNLMAVHVLETVGPQEYELKSATLAERAATAYGDTAATELTSRLS